MMVLVAYIFPWQQLESIRGVCVISGTLTSQAEFRKILQLLEGEDDSRTY